jgi:hypothetical protein
MFWNMVADVQQQFAKYGTVVLPHPPHFPNLTQCDYYFHPQMKDQLKGHHSKNTTETQMASKTDTQCGFQKSLKQSENAGRSVYLLKDNVLKATNCI